MFTAGVATRIMRGQPESPVADKSTCGKFTKNWRMLPGVTLLALSIIAIAAALIWNSPWLCIPFGVGVLLSGYVIHLGHQFKNLYTQSQLTEMLGVHDRMYDAQIQEHQTQLRQQGEMIGNLETQLQTTTALAERFERIRESLTGVQGEARGQLSVLEEQVDLLKQERENLGEEQKQYLDGLIEWTDQFREMISPETIQRQLEIQSALSTQIREMRGDREQMVRSLASMEARAQELEQQVVHLRTERERLSGIVDNLAEHGNSVRDSSLMLQGLLSPKKPGNTKR